MVMRFGERLRDVRRQHGYESQHALAAALHLGSNSTVSVWERRRYPPRPESVERLAKLFRISVAELLEGVDQPTTFHSVPESENLQRFVLTMTAAIESTHDPQAVECFRVGLLRLTADCLSSRGKPPEHDS